MDIYKIQLPINDANSGDDHFPYGNHLFDGDDRSHRKNYLSDVDRYCRFEHHLLDESDWHRLEFQQKEKPG